MTINRDVWIFDDLETIAIYYPELEEERCILNTQSVFCDYKTSRIAKKNVVLEQIALGNYDVSDPNFLLSTDQNQAVSSRNKDLMEQSLPFYLFPDSHEEYLKAAQWSRYLIKTGIRPGNSLFHNGFYPTYDSGGTEIDRGWFKTRQFYFPDRENNRALFIANLAHIGEKNAGRPDEHGYESTGYKPDISDDKTARLHFPLAYFPPLIDYGTKDIPILWNPEDPDGSSNALRQKYSSYGSRGLVWANTLISACIKKNKKITYDQIIRSSGKYGYNITIDLSIIGLGVYEWDFEHDLKRFFDPIGFFTEVTRKFLDNGNTVRWGSAGCSLSDLKNIGAANNPWQLPVTYRFFIDDPELRFYGLAVGAFQARDSWVHNFLVGGAIPLCDPDFGMLHHVRHDKFGFSEPCMSSGKYLSIKPHNQSALDIFKKILGGVLTLGITFGISFINSAAGLSTSAKVVNSFLSVFKKISNSVLESAGAPDLVVSAFNYGLYEVCALKIEKSIKQGKDYQSIKGDIKRSLASTISRYALGLSSEQEQVEIDKAENVADIIVDYLTLEENKYAPHAKENIRKILSKIAENQESYLSQAIKYTTGKIKENYQIIGGTVGPSIQSKSSGKVFPIMAVAAGALIIANILKNK